MAAPLSGIRVLAVEQAVALPYATFLLAEMGADVIKVERPEGDVIRGWDSAAGGLSTGFVWLSANKKDIALDLSRPAGRDVVRRLAGRADVFVENFAPGVMARLGLADADLRPANPRLVYASLTGYGQDGPYRDVKAYDLLIQGESGLLTTTGYPDAPAKVGIPVTDLIGGSATAFGIVSALLDRQRSGVGRYLDVSMFDASLLWLGYYPQHYWHGGGEPPRTGMRHQYLCPYGPYRAADGKYVNLVVASGVDWARFCTGVVRRPDWLADPRFVTVAARRAHRDELEAAVEQQIATEPQAEWLHRLAAAGLPYGEVRGIGEVLAHPQLAARGLVVPADSPVGTLPVMRFPLAEPTTRRIPGFAADRDAILAEAGYSPAEAAALARDGTAPDTPVGGAG